MTEVEEARPPTGVFGAAVRLLWPTMAFLGGATVGVIVAAIILVAIYFSLAGRDEGPPPFIDPSVPSAQAGGPKGNGEVRVDRSDRHRTFQRCRGACDEITP